MKPSQGQKTFIVLILIALFFALAIMATYISYTITRADKQAFFSRDIASASDSCESDIKDHFGENLISARYDEISSAYKPQQKRYLIYFRVTARYEEDNVPSIEEWLAKCIVWETLGYVSDFEVYQL